MTIIKRLGYVSLGVPDLELASTFYTDVVNMAVTESGPGQVFLTGGFDHHWLRLIERERPGVARVGYEAASPEALDELSRRLDSQGIRWVEGGNLDEDRLSRSLVFTSPEGLEIEVFEQMVSLPYAPTQDRVRMEELLHAVWYTKDVQASVSFLQGTLDFAPSDWIERIACFMRSEPLGYHHTVGLLKASESAGQLDHFCILVDEVDDVVRARNVALANGIKVSHDLIRHAASGSISTYVQDPIAGIRIEFCWGHDRIQDPDHRARLLLASPNTANTWNVPSNALGKNAFGRLANFDENLEQTTRAVLPSSPKQLAPSGGPMDALEITAAGADPDAGTGEQTPSVDTIANSIA